MEKRLLLALVLSLAFLFFYQQFIIKWIAPPQAKKGEADTRAAEKAGEKSEAKSVVPSVKKEPVSLPAYKEETVEVETPLYKAVFSNRGGAIKSWKLKKYKEGMEQTSPDVEMIAHGLSEYPLQDKLAAIKESAATETVYFKPSKTTVSLNQGQKEVLVFSWAFPEGITVEKRCAIEADTYTLQVETFISNTSAVPWKGEFSTGLAASIPFLEKRSGSYHKGPIAYAEGKILTKDIKKEGEEIIAGTVGWLGLEEMYFLSAVIPKKMEDVRWSTIIGKDVVKATATVPINLMPHAHAIIGYAAYLGPKEMDILKTQGVHLEDSINLGWFSFLAKPLLVVLNFFYSYIHNYGLVIILLTVIIKVLFHPLTKKGLDSMKEMQRVQPQIAALRERYKDDKEKMNRELMELYKRYKINPVGGCLPMILQIPVFIALYNVLSASIELRHAPFALWIHDLSAKDPSYITPVLMGATMLIQQKMTPSGMDPAQAKMMLIMPVIFTFMFLNFPSGLVIYWLVNNVLSIAQQYYIQKTTK